MSIPQSARCEVYVPVLQPALSPAVWSASGGKGASCRVHLPSPLLLNHDLVQVCEQLEFQNYLTPHSFPTTPPLPHLPLSHPFPTTPPLPHLPLSHPFTITPLPSSSHPYSVRPRHLVISAGGMSKHGRRLRLLTKTCLKVNLHSLNLAQFAFPLE